MKRRYQIAAILLALFILFPACKKDWDEHYNSEPETVDQNVWEAIKENADLSSFVQYLETYDIDSIFNNNNAYTLFIPTNDAFEEFLLTDSVSLGLILYHISQHHIQSGSIDKYQRIQMLSEKFAVFEKQSYQTLFDGIVLESESPLYRNGKYYLLNQVAKIRPNLFEYFAETNPVFKSYILGLDSIILDRELSRPVGYNEDGKTIYDSVTIIFNEFEDLYFPIREEHRFKTATIVFPLEEDYNNALDEMAQTLGDVYQDYSDIPEDWQQEILIPYLLEHGVFENSLSELDFIFSGQINDTLKLKNILGDSIAIDYTVKDKYLCSNGVAFNYSEFTVPDTLFKGPVRLELEDVVDETGVDKYSWNEDFVTVNSDVPYAPVQKFIASASNDTLVSVIFDQDYSGAYSLEIELRNLFPRKYLMVVRSRITIGGIYDIFLNDQQIRTIDFWDFNHGEGLYFFESVTGDYYFPVDGYCKWDAWAINENEYGNANLRFEYKGPGEINTHGLSIDYIDFIPYDE